MNQHHQTQKRIDQRCKTKLESLTTSIFFLYIIFWLKRRFTTAGKEAIALFSLVAGALNIKQLTDLLPVSCLCGGQQGHLYFLFYAIIR